MKLSKLGSVTFAVFSLINSDSVFATCKTIEFAELQSFTKKELKDEYCMNTLNRAIYAERHQQRVLEMARWSASDEALDKAENTLGRVCDEQAKRVERVFEKAHGSKPDCNSERRPF